MATALRRADSWLAATIDVLLAAFGWSLVWYPTVFLGNALLGAPLAAGTVHLVVAVLAIGAAYPVVAGDWSLGRLGDFVFVLTVSVVAVGFVGTAVTFATGTSFSGASRVPQAATWAAAYVVAYAVVYRSEQSILT